MRKLFDMKTLFVFFTCFMMALMSVHADNDHSTFRNPILSGFHPDPSICRVGDDYYMVNSSFEWFPGIPIYKSKDLVNWKLIGYGITRPEQMQFVDGLKDSRGIYAVTIRYHEGLFYLITTCVQCEGNFYITAKDPAGPWSDPVWLADRVVLPENESGIRLAKNLLSSGFMDIIELSKDVSMVELDVKPEWEGKTLIELSLRKKYGINVVAVVQNKDVSTNINPEEPLNQAMKLIVIANTSKLNKLK